MARKKGKAKSAKKAKRANGSHEVVAVGANYKRTVKEFVGRVENLLDDLASERGKYMNACKPIHEDIKEVYVEAKEAGIPTKALKAAVKMREYERKKDAEREKLDSPDQDELDRIRMALGDLEGTPLGDAAVAHAQGETAQETAEAAH